MTDILSEFDGNVKPVCHGSPRPLQELASTKIAFDIWLAKFNEFYPSENDSRFDLINLDLNIEISIAVPLKIKQMINSRVLPIVWELDKWVVYMIKVHNNLSYDQIYTSLNLVSLGGNGAVHFKDTIANFLEDDSLDDRTRFEIACVNCMEEKIHVFWPLMSCNLSIDNLQFVEDFMLYYWICRKRGELHRIPLERFSCIERLMVDKCRRKHCIHLAVEYFLTSLNPDDRFVELDKMLDLSNELDVQDEFFYAAFHQRYERSFYRSYVNFTRLFPNIDEPTQRQFLDKYTIDILYAFVTCFRPVEYVVQCFLCTRDFITPVSFYNRIIKRIINYSRNYSGHYQRSKKKKSFLYDYIETALEQIWLNTPPYLKEYILDNLSTVLDEFSSSLHFDQNSIFLLAISSDVSVELRNNIWNEFWPKWMKCTPPSQFKELMEFCLIKTETIEEFENTFTYTKEFHQNCVELICEGYFIKLDEFFSTLYSNRDLILSIKKRILTNEVDIFHRDVKYIEQYAKYIDYLFSDVTSAADFKDNLISSDAIMKFLFISGKIHVINFCNFKFIVSLFVSPRKHAEIKNKFLTLFHYDITCGNLHQFNEFGWSSFLMWCSDNSEERMDAFMKSLQIDVVFEAAFRTGLRLAQRERINFMDWFNQFFIWVFKSREISGNYIRGRVEYYESMDAADVQRIFGEDKQSVIDAMTNELLNNVGKWDSFLL